jgi:hypothetical protein
MGIFLFFVTAAGEDHIIRQTMVYKYNVTNQRCLSTLNIFFWKREIKDF